MVWMLVVLLSTVEGAWATEAGGLEPQIIVHDSEGAIFLLPPAFPVGVGLPDPCGPERADQRVVLGQSRARRDRPWTETSVGLGVDADGRYRSVWCHGTQTFVDAIEPECPWSGVLGVATCPTPGAWRHEIMSRWTGGPWREAGVEEVLPPGERRSRLFPEGAPCAPPRLVWSETGQGPWEGPDTNGEEGKSIPLYGTRAVSLDVAGEVCDPPVAVSPRRARRANRREWVVTRPVRTPDDAIHLVHCQAFEAVHDVVLPERPSMEVVPGSDGLAWVDVYTWKDRRGRTWHRAMYEDAGPLPSCGSTEP